MHPLTKRSSPRRCLFEDESSPDVYGEQDVSKRLADLEHDNNVMRGMIAEVQMEHVRLVKDFDDGLVSGTLTDDRAARALDRLYKADRASLLTKLVLAAVEKFGISLDQIHNDSTSIKFSGAYDNQDTKAIQLKRGHSKDHRPDLKQLVYSLSVSRDGAIPIHFKSYG